MPSSNKIIEDVIKFTCAKSEIENILELEGIRFEIILEIIRHLLDNELKRLEYFEKCDKPNSIHFYLSEMTEQGVNVIITNFCFLIDHISIRSIKELMYIKIIFSSICIEN